MPHELMGGVFALLPALRLEFAASSGAEFWILAFRPHGNSVVTRRQGARPRMISGFSLPVSFGLDAVTVILRIGAR